MNVVYNVGPKQISDMSVIVFSIALKFPMDNVVDMSGVGTWWDTHTSDRQMSDMSVICHGVQTENTQRTDD